MLPRLITFTKRIAGKPLVIFRKLSLKKKILLVIVVLIILVIASNVISSVTAPPPYTTQKVNRENIIEIVTESGNISASGKIDVYSPTDGVITETYVRNGDFVKEGDTLFKVESSATEQESQQAYSTYLAAVSTLNASQSNADLLRAEMYAQWKSFTDLATNSTYEKGDDTPNLDNRKAAEFQISQDTWSASEKKYKDQETAIAQARALVSSTQILYLATKDSVVKAQTDGTIKNMSIAKGSTVSIANPAVAASLKPALILSQESKTEASILITESDVSKIKEGQRVSVKVNALDDKQFSAKVDRVDSIGTNNQGVVTYTAYLTFDDENIILKPGMTVDAEIVTEELKGVLSVPNSAVKPYKGGRAVRVPDAKTPEKFKYVPVVIGIRGKDKTQIVKGVSEGDEIITTLSNEALKRPGPFGN